MAFAIEKTTRQTDLGFDIYLVCESFQPICSINSDEIRIELNWKEAIRAVAPFRNIESPTVFDYKYQSIVGGDHQRSYSNSDLRVDLELVNGELVPIMEYFVNDVGETVSTYKMIGNIDHWMKWGGVSIIADVRYTLSQNNS